MNKFINSFFSLITGFMLAVILLPGCSPSKRAVIERLPSKLSFYSTDVPSKAILNDASIIVFRNGFRIQNGFYQGEGTRYWLDKDYSRTEFWTLPADSINTIVYLESVYPGWNAGGNVALVISGIALTVTAIECVSCPKCCFGSCPTVYTYSGEGKCLEAELFSSSISRLLQESDLDILRALPDSGNRFKLTVTNEALESHYTDYFKLKAAWHPAGTTVMAGADGRLKCGRSTTNGPDLAVNSLGVDVCGMIDRIDGQSYRSGDDLSARMINGPATDYIDIKLDKEKINSDTALLVLNYRNTLMSTVLLYEVIFASQGINALGWISRMNTDTAYAREFKKLYGLFSGIKVFVNNHGRWDYVSTIKDAGPINWKEMAVEIPASKNRDLMVRLQFVPDNFMIDFAGFDGSYSAREELIIDEPALLGVETNSVYPANDIINAINSSDGRYLFAEPGTFTDFNYKVETRKGMELTLFIESEGFYNEWLRPEWLKNKSGKPFDLTQVYSIFNKVAKSWQENKTLFEKEFFTSKIPVRSKP